MAPGRFLASSTKSFTVFHGASARTASTVGSAVNRAIGRSEFKGYIWARPSTTSASGITVRDESDNSTV
jgi:hypothetical protein